MPGLPEQPYTNAEGLVQLSGLAGSPLHTNIECGARRGGARTITKPLKEAYTREVLPWPEKTLLLRKSLLHGSPMGGGRLGVNPAEALCHSPL